MKPLTTEEFIKRAKEVHGDKYDYSLSVYIIKKLEVLIICPKHGIFKQTPDAHLRGQGCPKCKAESTSKRCRKSYEDFVKQANEIHNYKYDYSKFNYINSTTKGIIICPKHNLEWKQLPSNHLSGKGCPECGKEKISKQLTISNNEYITRCKEIHPEYDYSITNYTGMANSILYICSKHGVITQNAQDHLHNRAGCPKCNRSHGEKAIENYLIKNNIEYISQYKINIDTEINSTGKANIDFYLPNYNMFIEYNGILHYVAVERFGGELKLQKQVKRDNYIKKYCKSRKINLIEIPYCVNLNLINEILDMYLIDNLNSNTIVLDLKTFYKLLSK